LGTGYSCTTNITTNAKIGDRYMQHVLTLWKDCGWSEQTNHNPEDVMRGYDALNQAVNELSRYATIHSLTYSNLVIPETATLRLFSAVVYSGDAPIEMFEPGSLYTTVREADFVWPVETDIK
jgi:hypothetical protein